MFWKRIAIMFLASTMVLGGCSLEDVKESFLQEQEEADEKDDEEDEDEKEEREREDSDEEEEREDEITGDSLIYQKDNITITFPDDWEGEYLIEETEDGFSVYHKDNAEEMEGMGFLFSVLLMESPPIDWPEAECLAYSEEGIYVAVYPTDVCYFYDVPDLAEGYCNLSADVKNVVDSIEIAGDNMTYYAEQYILPMSEYYSFSDFEIMNFSVTSLEWALNEIYARHGCYFEDEYVQAKFEQLTWYENQGISVEEVELSEIEANNADLISDFIYRIREQFPYPMELAAGTKHEIDLNGDGLAENVQYDVAGTEEYTGTLTVDGQVYSLEDMGIYLCTPEEAYFWITDITTFYGGVEIMIYDDGPSSDPVNYFFSYDGDLHYLGNVPGNARVDYYDWGAANSVNGRVRSDLIETTYAYGNWYYDYEAQTITITDAGLYELEPWYAHELLMDLPVHSDCSVDSPQRQMEAGQTVYFLRTDGLNWIELRAEDGTQGWIYVEDNMVMNVDADSMDVFEGLMFFD